jgi:hypothetical protein
VGVVAVVVVAAVVVGAMMPLHRRHELRLTKLLLPIT